MSDCGEFGVGPSDRGKLALSNEIVYIRSMLIESEDLKEELLEALYDLKHDLGKYIKLPVLMLKKEASAVELSAEVIRAVEQTRKGPKGVLSAQMLLSNFEDEWGTYVEGEATYARLTSAVDDAGALAMRAKTAPESLTRGEVESVLFSVADAIEALLREVEGG